VKATPPPRVRAGDTVAVVSPSLGAVGRWPHRVERARAYLESLELRVRMTTNAARDEGWASASPELRAADLHEAFLDDEVAVVLAAIGGNHSNQLLPHLDYELVRSRPKIFQGFSDITVLHWAFLKHAGLSTFYGPALVSELGEHPSVLPYTDRWLRAAWLDSRPLAFEPAEEWTDERLEWNTQDDLTRPRELRPSEGWVTLHEGVAEGWLLGGCLETICWHLKGSESWIDPAGAIFFLETSEETPSVGHIDSYLTDLEQLGLFGAISGLVVGRPYGYGDDARRTLWEVVRARAERWDVPALGNVDCGHTDPMLTLPLGALARLDATERRFELLEAPTAEPR
jgi:muramoyltetrapeptide carboxypeptidase LdcA involved in peptidoglycan recycling